MIRILPLKQLRRLKEFSRVFKITEDTVIAYAGAIYSNKPLPPDVLIHERVHIKQQQRYGLDFFIKEYINNKDFRLKMEKEAYHAQLASIDDEGLRDAVYKDSLNSLTSGLYGKISLQEAEELLKPKEVNAVDSLVGL